MTEWCKPFIPKGHVRMRYPGNDPENGPAYPQRWNGTAWECAGHDYKTYTEPECNELGHPTGPGVFRYVACAHCGDYKGSAS